MIPCLRRSTRGKLLDSVLETSPDPAHHAVPSPRAGLPIVTSEFLQTGVILTLQRRDLPGDSAAILGTPLDARPQQRTRPASIGSSWADVSGTWVDTTSRVRKRPGWSYRRTDEGQKQVLAGETPRKFVSAWSRSRPLAVVPVLSCFGDRPLGNWRFSAVLLGKQRASLHRLALLRVFYAHPWAPRAGALFLFALAFSRSPASITPTVPHVFLPNIYYVCYV